MHEAEALYYGGISTKLVKRAFCAEAAYLERRSPDAGAYLRYLMMSGKRWPRVEGVHRGCPRGCVDT